MGLLQVYGQDSRALSLLPRTWPAHVAPPRDRGGIRLIFRLPSATPRAELGELGVWWGGS